MAEPKLFSKYPPLWQRAIIQAVNNPQTEIPLEPTPWHYQTAARNHSQIHAMLKGIRQWGVPEVPLLQEIVDDGALKFTKGWVDGKEPPYNWMVWVRYDDTFCHMYGLAQKFL